MAGAGTVSVVDDFPDQRIGGEDVVPHRSQASLRVARHRRGIHRFLVKPEDASVAVRFDDPEGGGFRTGHRDTRHRNVGALLDVVLEHLAGVHPVQVVGAEHEDVVGPLVSDDVEVLVDGVRRT